MARKQTKKTTALAVRKKGPAPVVKRRKPAAKPPAPTALTLPDVSTVLREGEIAIADLGLVAMTLTAEQEELLSQPVNVDDIRWKPKVKNGPPEIPYVPHPKYRALYNKAFGRLNWALVPVGTPMINNNLAIIPYVLTLYGKRVKFAYGEQDYFENNRQQTYGDVLESTKASALRRISKDMGIWLELWDKDFLDRLPKPRGYQGAGQGWGDDPEYRGEPRRVNPSAPPQRREPPPDMHQGDADAVIHDNQATRFWRHIVPNSGRDEAEVRDWLFREYGVQGSAKIKQRDYNAIERAVRAEGPLPRRAR